MYQIPEGLKKTASMVILKHNDQFLLLKRNRPPNLGMYVPVGGKLDPFEDPRQAAIRETYEETGFHLREVNFAGLLVETSQTKYNWQSYIYWAEIEYQDPPSCDEGELAWIPANGLLEVPTPPTDWHIYQLMLEKKPFVFNAIYNEQMQLISMINELTGKDYVD